MDYKSFYAEAAIKVREQAASKIRKKRNVNMTPEGKDFIKLTKAIPNWKTYLTDKQLEVADLYLALLSTTEVDYQLRLTEGVTYHRLFGVLNTERRGAYGTLKIVKKQLDKDKRNKII